MTRVQKLVGAAAASVAAASVAAASVAAASVAAAPVAAAPASAAPASAVNDNGLMVNSTLLSLSPLFHSLFLLHVNHDGCTDLEEFEVAWNNLPNSRLPNDGPDRDERRLSATGSSFVGICCLDAAEDEFLFVVRSGRRKIDQMVHRRTRHPVNSCEVVRCALVRLLRRPLSVTKFQRRTLSRASPAGASSLAGASSPAGASLAVLVPLTRMIPTAPPLEDTKTRHVLLQ